MGDALFQQVDDHQDAERVGGEDGGQSASRKRRLRMARMVQGPRPEAENPEGVV